VGVRERLNQNRTFAITAAAVMLLAGAAFGLWQAFGGRQEVRRDEQRAYFSADDGTSWFPADAAKMPPIEHEGKTAYRVRVFRCPTGKQFVSQLERYTPDDKKRLEAQIQALVAEGRQVDVAQLGLSPTMQVKKPGEKEWMALNASVGGGRPAVSMQPKCPDGHTEGLEPVYPQ
jgi:hypothetical protein